MKRKTKLCVPGFPRKLKQRIKDINRLFKLWLKDEVELDRVIGDQDYALGWTNELFIKEKRIGWILVFDYDVKDRNVIVKDYNRLKKKYKLGSGILLETTNGFHLYVLDVVDKKKLVTVLRDSKSDQRYLSTGIKSDYCFNVRLSRKYGKEISFDSFLPSPYLNNYSFAHYEMLVHKYTGILVAQSLIKDVNDKYNFNYTNNFVKANVRGVVYRIKKRGTHAK